MKCKRILALSLLVCNLLVFVGCKANLEEIAWVGFDKIPFNEMLEDGLEKQIDKKVSVTIKNGWDVTETEITVDERKTVTETYTYVAEVMYPIAATEITSFEFYMSVERGNLEIYGMRTHGKDGNVFVKKDEATVFLETMAAMI